MATGALESDVGGIGGCKHDKGRALRRFSKIDLEAFRHCIIGINFLAGVAGRHLGISGFGKGGRRSASSITLTCFVKALTLFSREGSNQP